MIRLKDIAKEAGVSVSTVSKFLSGKGSFSPRTEERIRQAIEALGFQKDPARGKNSKLKVVGVIIPDIENPFFSSVVKALELLLFRYGYFLLLCNTENNVHLEEQFIHYLSRSGARGILLVPATSEKRPKPLGLNIPVLLFDRTIREANFPTVMTNHYKGARIAVSYLIQKGCRRIAFIGGRKDVNAYEDRLKGYIDELRERKLEFDPDIVIESDFSFQGGYHAITLLHERGKPFDAVFAANDLTALGAIERLKELGIAVPGDVSVIGFDDIWLSRLTHPQLTTVRQPIHELCKEAVTTLIELMDKGVRAGSKILEPQLVVRESC
ncbi:MAG: LacI family DNA-binding transcriptional regulator [Candidatus Caldatribacterium sp.]|nr:LacI family DNA-binding transcriptional regulator [Candidatus Caldatribacterium sp.]